jgi:beta-glucosidase
MSSNIDDRALHEVPPSLAILFRTTSDQKKLYLWPFTEAVKANVSFVMCSYNKVGPAWACENGTLITNILKNELDFQGWVVSGMSQLSVI